MNSLRALRVEAVLGKAIEHPTILNPVVFVLAMYGFFLVVLTGVLTASGLTGLVDSLPVSAILGAVFAATAKAAEKMGQRRPAEEERQTRDNLKTEVEEKGTPEEAASTIKETTSLLGPALTEDEKRAFEDILNFGEDEIYIVYPPRITTEKAILPGMSEEDFRAINIILRLLPSSLGWKRPIHVRDSKHFDLSQRGRNLVVICSPRTNTVTRHVIRKLRRERVRWFDFKPIRGPDESERIVRDSGEVLESRSYHQLAGLAGDQRPADAALDDVAVLAKFTNPFNDQNKILIVAGVRGIGTWGASEYLRNKVVELHDKKKAVEGKTKDGDFAAYIDVNYMNRVIFDVKLTGALDDIS